MVGNWDFHSSYATSKEVRINLRCDVVVIVVVVCNFLNLIYGGGGGLLLFLNTFLQQKFLSNPSLKSVSHHLKTSLRSLIMETSGAQWQLPT